MTAEGFMIDATSLCTTVLRQAIFDLTGLRLRMESAYRPGQRTGKAHQARYFARHTVDTFIFVQWNNL